ncbi:hypothetical protein V8F33_004735 [Rhypophila sp. PSN 637]
MATAERLSPVALIQNPGPMAPAGQTGPMAPAANPGQMAPAGHPAQMGPIINPGPVTPSCQRGKGPFLECVVGVAGKSTQVAVADTGSRDQDQLRGATESNGRESTHGYFDQALKTFYQHKPLPSYIDGIQLLKHFYGSDALGGERTKHMAVIDTTAKDRTVEGDQKKFPFYLSPAMMLGAVCALGGVVPPGCHTAYDFSRLFGWMLQDPDTWQTSMPSFWAASHFDDPTWIAEHFEAKNLSVKIPATIVGLGVNEWFHGGTNRHGSTVTMSSDPPIEKLQHDEDKLVKVETGNGPISTVSYHAATQSILVTAMREDSDSDEFVISPVRPMVFGS